MENKKEEGRAKHHFVQQFFMKNTFHLSEFQVFGLDKYRNSGVSNGQFSYFILNKVKTEDLFNSNLLLNDETDKYWSNIENNSFFKNFHLLNMKSNVNHMTNLNNDEVYDLINYIFMLAVRSPMDFWDACKKIESNDPLISVAELKLKINNNLIERHTNFVNYFYNNNNNIMLKYRNFSFNEPISVVGETIGLFFDSENPKIKLKIYLTLAKALSNKSSIKLTFYQWFQSIIRVFNLSVIVPHNNGFTYIKNNTNDNKIHDDILKEILKVFYDSDIYFQKVLMTSLNQIVILNEKRSQESYDFLNTQISQIVNKNTEIYNIYNKYQKLLRQA